MIMKNYMENKLKKGNFSALSPFLSISLSCFFLPFLCSLASQTPTRLFCFTFFSFSPFSFRQQQTLRSENHSYFQYRSPSRLHSQNIHPQQSSINPLAFCLPAINFFRFFFAALPFALFSHFDAKQGEEKKILFVCFASFFAVVSNSVFFLPFFSSFFPFNPPPSFFVKEPLAI